MGFSSLIACQKILATSPWIVFKNETSTLFITGDNPVCLQYWNPNRSLGRLDLLPSSLAPISEDALDHRARPTSRRSPSLRTIGSRRDKLIPGSGSCPASPATSPRRKRRHERASSSGTGRGPSRAPRDHAPSSPRDGARAPPPEHLHQPIGTGVLVP